MYAKPKSREDKKPVDSAKKKRGIKTVGFRLENMPNNVRRAISFNASNSQESDLDKVDEDDSVITEFRNRSNSASPSQSHTLPHRQNLNRRTSNVIDYGSRYKTVDSSYGTLRNGSLSPAPLSSVDRPALNGTITNSSFIHHAKSNGIPKAHIPLSNGHTGYSLNRKLNFSDVGNSTLEPPESLVESDVESKESEMLQVCFSEEEGSSANETSYVIENHKNQNLELPQNQKLSPKVVSNGEAGGAVECNNNLVQLPPQPAKLQSRWSIKSLLRRKPSHPISLPPELEAAFLKSESLIFLSEEELVARYESHKQTLRVRLFLFLRLNAGTFGAWSFFTVTDSNIWLFTGDGILLVTMNYTY